MHIKTKFIAILLALSLLSPALVSAKRRANTSTSQQQSAQLTKAEEATLLWMREEEKLARDVYLTLYDTWHEESGASILSNIAKSEQSHMDAVLKKIESYGLDDSATSEIGQFNDPEVQVLYDELVEQGLQSYISALEVGREIEVLDISDINAAIEETNKLDLQTTYESLLEGSRNHLRAFAGQLDELVPDEEYESLYIDQDLYEAIIDAR